MIEQELLDYIRTEIAYDRAESLSADDQLLHGALDSIDILRLAVFVEEKYAVTIDDNDLVPENFATVNALSGLIRTKRSD